MGKLYGGETAEVILERILARVAHQFDKREGSIIYDASAPESIEFEYLFSCIDYALNQAFAKTAEREYLILKAMEKGLAPEEATHAKVTGRFTPETLDIPIGARFFCGEYYYNVTEKRENGLYYLTSETVGSEVNGNTGRMIPVESIPGLKTAEIIEVSVLGDDEEETEAFRARYFDAIKVERYAGNIADTKAKCLEQPGVGAVKVYPCWNGPSTIRCVILDSEYGVPTDTLVDDVQEAINPLEIDGKDTDGEGWGLAAIGQFVTIQGANLEPIEISSRLVYKSGYNYDSCKEQINAVLEAYLQELNESWMHRDNIIVRITEIESRLIGINGIEDAGWTAINGDEYNCVIEDDAIVEFAAFTPIA